MLKYLILFLPILSFSQIVPNIGYSYMSTNAGYLGVDYLDNADGRKNNSFSVGGGIYLGSFNNDFKIIPALNLSYSKDLLLTNVVISPKHINPSIGLNMINILWIKGGYSFSFDSKTNIKGFTFGINLLLNKHLYFGF